MRQSSVEAGSRGNTPISCVLRCSTLGTSSKIPLRRRPQHGTPHGLLEGLLSEQIPLSSSILLLPLLYRRTFHARGASPTYSISMRSRPPASSGSLSGLASSPTPRKTSNPARRKWPAARRRRSPGTSTYATTPSSEPRRRPREPRNGSGAIAQPHAQLATFDLRTGRLEAHHRVR